MHLPFRQRQPTSRYEPVLPSTGKRQKRRKGRLFLFALCICLLCVLILYSLRRPIMVAMADSLVYESQLRRCDAVLVLSGGRSERIEKAIALHKAGYADTIQMTLPEEISDDAPAPDGLHKEVRMYKAFFELRQVAPDRVKWSSEPYYSTYDEAIFLKERMSQNGWDEAIIVPGYFQSQRARWSFDHAFDESSLNILVSPAAPEIVSTTNWWTHEEGFITVENEWIKGLYYRLKGMVGKP